MGICQRVSGLGFELAKLMSRVMGADEGKCCVVLMDEFLFFA